MALSQTTVPANPVPPVPFWGMGIYTRTDDGTLSGVWNNNGTVTGSGLHEEIARKSDQQPLNLIGMYNVSWIEGDASVHSGTLEIVQGINMTSIWTWRNDRGVIVFNGAGIQIGINRYAILYWDDTGISFPV